MANATIAVGHCNNQSTCFGVGKCTCSSLCKQCSAARSAALAGEMNDNLEKPKPAPPAKEELDAAFNGPPKKGR
jgi:hypothetical protein